MPDSRLNKIGKCIKMGFGIYYIKILEADGNSKKYKVHQAATVKGLVIGPFISVSPNLDDDGLSAEIERHNPEWIA